MTIPLTKNKDRMTENLSVFDFTLSDEDMSAINAIGEGKNLFVDYRSPEMAEMLKSFSK